MLGTARTARKRVLPAILQAGQTITAIAGRDEAKVKEFQIEFGIPGAFPWSLAQSVLELPNIDAIYIPLPNSMHAEWTVRALEAGKHVLCEKPLALTSAEAERVIVAAQSSGRVLIENIPKTSLETGDSTLNSRFPLEAIDIHQCFQATEAHRLRYDPSLGGGSFLDLGCYGVDFVHRLLDCEMEVLNVAATPPAAERRAWGLVDEASIVHARAAGVDVLITSSFAQPPRQDFILRFAGGETQRIERTNDTVGLLQSFESMTRTDPADIVRWRRNAAVLEYVQARIREQMQY